MRVMSGRNVNELFYSGLDYLLSEGEWSRSRAGDVLVSPVPVTSMYERPQERVLFDATRDANPFFHGFEGLWMLAGQSSATELDFYVRDFGKRFAESDWKIHGAYGERWRNAFGFDQLSAIVDKLKKDFTDRQCVLQMWDCTTEQQSPIDGIRAESHGQNDLLGSWKDRPCNTHVYFRVRDASLRTDPVLDMTVCCRSNDIIWGAYGANAVHFSMLQEYVAGRVGVGIGRMYQVSNNFHGYVDVLAKMNLSSAVPKDNWYASHPEIVPMGEDWNMWDRDLESFMDWHRWLTGMFREKKDGIRDSVLSTEICFVNDWFSDVPVQMARAYAMYRLGDIPQALVIASGIGADDWHLACTEWLQRRLRVEFDKK